MENLLGFIIFLIIIVVSIVNKIRTENAGGEDDAEVEPRETGRKASGGPLDLPEATRRMLYGDGNDDIVVAKPRRPSSERSARPAQPAAKPHPVSARRVEIDRTPQPQRRVETPPFVQKRPEPIRTQAGQTRQPMREGMRAQPQQPTRKPVQQPRPQRQPAPQSGRAATRTSKKPPLRAVRQTRPKPARATADGSAGIGLGTLMASKSELARGIMLREILGPPKALEDYGRF